MSRLDFSFSWFYGYSLYPDYLFDKIKSGDEYKFNIAYDVAQKYDRLNILGTDFALAIDPIIIRGEAAYIRTGFDAQKEPEWRQPYLHYIVGTEWQCMDDLVFSSQYSMKYIPGFKTAEELFGESFAGINDERLITREITRFNRRSHGVDRRINDLMTLKISSFFYKKPY